VTGWAPDLSAKGGRRHKIENMFGRLKDWLRIHIRYDRCAHTFMSAMVLAAVVIFWSDH
jgi:transposase